jgi:hypothetical protein
MASRHLSIRVPERALEALDAEVRRSGRTRSEVAKELIEEGLRMREHPLITFRQSATGRKAALVDGPYIWWAVQVLKDVVERGGDAVAETAELTDLRPDQVEVIARYYAQYPNEIDEFIELNNREADEAEAAWLREQALLHG